MIRTQLQLTPEQAAALKRVAAKRNVSMAEVVRELVDAHLVDAAGAGPRHKARAVVGRYRSGRSGTSVEHDAVLAEELGR